jgi:predicted acetyltransferase
MKTAAERDTWRQELSAVIAEGQALGAFEDGRPAGGAMFFDMRQWWHGREVPMAGVGGVKVAPEDRGKGIGRGLMTALLAEIAGRGYPLSALYPATMPIYRSLGWELAGARYTAVVPGQSLRPLVAPDAAVGAPAVAAPTLRRAGPGDAEAVNSLIGRVHEAARDCGPITWDLATMRRWLAEPDIYQYICDDGYVAYEWHNGNEEIFVLCAHGLTPQTVRALWSQVASHASVAETIRAFVGPFDPFWWLTRERDTDLTRRAVWMLRVVDAPAAIAARGFPPAVALSVPLVIVDDARPANSGRWELTVAGGKGALLPDPSPSAEDSTPASGTPGGTPSVLTLGPRGLAALYSGAPVPSLRLAGLAAGGTPDTDAALDAAFATTTWMLDAF